MDKAIADLKQRFTEPSAELIQQNPLCGICWNDLDGEDRPVKLPCGHVFGEECVISWAKGITPTGRYHGCPYCRAELLPPSLHSRTSALLQVLSDLWPLMKMLLGGGQGVAFVIALIIIGATAGYCSEPEVTTRIRSNAWTVMVTFLTIKIFRFIG